MIHLVTVLAWKYKYFEVLMDIKIFTFTTMLTSTAILRNDTFTSSNISTYPIQVSMGSPYPMY